MTLDQRTQYGNTLRSSLAVFVYPLQFFVTIPGDMGEWISEEFTSRSSLKKENGILRTQNDLLTAQLQRFVSLEAENIRLRELMQSSKKVGEKVLVAELVSVGLDPYQRQVKLNKGSRHNVHLGQPLIDSNGIMGQVVKVDSFNSIAMLITDPDHTLPVQVNRNGQRAIAVGLGAESLLEIPYQPNNTDIKAGDLLVTSGLGGIYPAGYPAAKVVSVEINPSLQFASIIARPTANLDRGRQVLLVWTKQKPSSSGPTQADKDPS